jgi:hypothetical protein
MQAIASYNITSDRKMQTLLTGGGLEAGVHLGRALHLGGAVFANATVAPEEFCVGPCHGTVALVRIVAGAHPLVSVAVAVGGGALFATASHMHCF